MGRTVKIKTQFISDLEQILDDIRWIVIYYFDEEHFKTLKEDIVKKKDGKVRDFIIKLYRTLPKAKFNTLVNPPGWSALESFCTKHDIG